eukprot:m.53770 g.53770  ORF g.53770 m.53770 type:complete len:67 (-) comp15458_c1_seq4:157-357(-)
MPVRGGGRAILPVYARGHPLELHATSGGMHLYPHEFHCEQTTGISLTSVLVGVRAGRSRLLHNGWG